MWKFSQLSAKNFPVKITQKISKMSSKFTQADKIKKYETERLIKYLREDSKSEGLELDNDFFTKLEEENITGHLFLKLTRQEFREFGMGLRPALELEDYIKKLYDRKARVNLGDFLVKK
ncbi:unnamed protein product [Rhizophagus irregularis]|uniref:SAM domain-containing protein n=1 Tax=Rhizophagus irregularis (strain DAOM 197198w) TaxID=1432141 RepID=A0A015MKI4_RHIIW|nr:hypothetical protein RirG_115070 [Rhizophagus irregularis DAOM 197198w]CAB4490135.1 unnamed protein product [Rhizophagus irregularis]